MCSMLYDAGLLIKRIIYQNDEEFDTKILRWKTLNQTFLCPKNDLQTMIQHIYLHISLFLRVIEERICFVCL